MDRKAQIEFQDASDARMRSYVSKWLGNPAVRDALERRPDDENRDDNPSLIEPTRQIG